MAGKLIAGNWKMHGTRAGAQSLAQAVCMHVQVRDESLGAKVVICPPAPLIPEVAAALAGSPVAVGGQDCHEAAEGAFTGDISAAMLKEAGCAYVIVGHSERRRHHGEGDAQVARKAAAALAAGLIPIVCVGESLEEREKGRAEEVVARQVRDSTPKNAAKSQFVLAYEPIWAIGTGKTPAGTDITAMHRHIADLTGGVAVLYGGSVNAANAKEILALPGVSGVLVGGASLKAEEFCAIIDAAL